MSSLDPSEEWRELSERYRQMSDEEIAVIARKSSDLTDVAQQALAGEVRHRGLKIEPEVEEPEPDPEPGPLGSDDPYAEERKLIELFSVWSQRDAFRVQLLLEQADIPVFFGPEKARSADRISSNFANGVSVKIMAVGVPWAREALMHYEPLDEPIPAPEDNVENEAPVRCPKCLSTEIVFLELEPEERSVADESSAKFRWTCDSCGNTWEDDGIAKNK